MYLCWLFRFLSEIRFPPLSVWAHVSFREGMLRSSCLILRKNCYRRFDNWAPRYGSLRWHCSVSQCSCHKQRVSQSQERKEAWHDRFICHKPIWPICKKRWKLNQLMLIFVYVVWWRGEGGWGANAWGTLVERQFKLYVLYLCLITIALLPVNICHELQDWLIDFW